MSLLDQLWDDTVAGPLPESGLGKLRKMPSLGLRPNPGKESGGGGVMRSHSEEATTVDEKRVTRSIMIVRPPGYTNGSSTTPPASPAGSTPPVSPFPGKNAGVCLSKGGRFPPYTSEGKPPKKVSKGAKDLTLCRVFRKKTCCDVAQTYPALLSVRRLASTGEASQECLQLWELLECSICDPQIGVQPGPPLICASFCDRVYQACANAYFSMDANKRVIAPCGVNDFVCGQAAEWVSNGTELCHAAGYAVKLSDDAYVGAEEASCYGGRASLDSIADSWRSSRSEFPQKDENLRVLEDFQQWVQEMPFSEKISWAVGGLVLTAGLLFMSKRKSHGQRQKLAAIQRAARRLDGKTSQNSPDSLVNRKGNRR
uniref:Folate receptor-like domain-containing protein n=1 Tax=Populus trichocarpa TaxID=3694 RepID=A0A2K2AAM1_POPTR